MSVYVVPKSVMVSPIVMNAQLESLHYKPLLYVANAKRAPICTQLVTLHIGPHMHFGLVFIV
jgi:hypothetical protein